MRLDVRLPKSLALAGKGWWRRVVRAPAVCGHIHRTYAQLMEEADDEVLQDFNRAVQQQGMAFYDSVFSKFFQE